MIDSRAPNWPKIHAGTQGEVGQFSSFLRILDLGNSGSELIDSDFQCWKVLQTMAGAALNAHSQDKGMEEAWGMVDKGEQKREIKFVMRVGVGEQEKELVSSCSLWSLVVWS